jgi:hypothetical protein
MTRQSGQIMAAIRGLGAAALVLVCAGGCVSHRVLEASWQPIPPSEGDSAAFAVARQTVREAFPASWQATQRAIISVGRRQFTCDGFLTASPAEGWHLALISMLGLVADVRVRNDGSTEVLKVTRIGLGIMSRRNCAGFSRRRRNSRLPGAWPTDGWHLKRKAERTVRRPVMYAAPTAAIGRKLKFGTGRAAFFTRRSPATGLSLAGRARCRVNSIWTRARINCKYGR